MFYDATSQRIKYLKYDVSNVLQAGSSIDVLGASGKTLAEYRYNGSAWTVNHTNVFGNDLIGKLDYASNQRYRNISDHLGSTRVVLDQTGSVTFSADYYPFGKTARESGSNSPKEKFNGKQLDDESALYNYGMRYYNADIARFITVDPLTKSFPELTPYQYASNNPVSNIDLDGLEGINFMSIWSALGGPVSVPTVRDKRPVNELSTSSKGVDFIKSWEGLKTEMYNDDAGHATIGYGHLMHYGEVNDNDKQGEFKNGITEDKAGDLMKTDIKDKAEAPLQANVTVELTQNQFDALVSFTFNLGEVNLKKSNLLDVVNSGKGTSDQIKKEFSKWNGIGGTPSEGLKKRREGEAKIYNENEYENNK